VKKAGPAAYLKPEGPNNALMAQQRQILEQFLAGPGFKVLQTTHANLHLQE
jgi:hypothetical protein